MSYTFGNHITKQIIFLVVSHKTIFQSWKFDFKVGINKEGNFMERIEIEMLVLYEYQLFLL